MEFVAQLVERQFVALVAAGSKPVKLPKMEYQFQPQDYRSCFQTIGSSNWLGSQIFALCIRVRISYRLHLAPIAQR